MNNVIDGGGKLDSVRVPYQGPSRGRDKIYYPFDKLTEPGLSFTAPLPAKRLQEAARRYREAGNMGKAFRAQDLAEGGCRVWRVK